MNNYKILTLIIAITLMLPVGIQGAWADNDAEVCHKGKTISISEKAVPAHIGHGDTEGACDDTPDPPPGLPPNQCDGNMNGNIDGAELFQWTGAFNNVIWTDNIIVGFVENNISPATGNGVIDTQEELDYLNEFVLGQGNHLLDCLPLE